MIAALAPIIWIWTMPASAWPKCSRLDLRCFPTFSPLYKDSPRERGVTTEPDECRCKSRFVWIEASVTATSHTKVA